MHNIIYHNVLNLKRLKTHLETDVILRHPQIRPSCVCLTRDKNYLKNRGITIVLDKDKLRHNYKLKPFSYYGFCELNGFRMKKINRNRDKNGLLLTEMEERCYHDINLTKCCVKILIDSKIHPIIDITHPLIEIV
jgi:hypothetical protein